MTQRKILIVGTSALHAQNMAALNTEGYTVILEENREHARQRVEQERPDVLLIDLMTPGMDAIEFCRAVRSSPNLDRPSIVLATSPDLSHEQKARPSEEADEILARPFDETELLARLRSLLHRRTLEEQVRLLEAERTRWNEALAQRIQEHVDQLASLSEVTHLLTESIDPDQHLRVILTTICHLLKAEASSLWLLDPLAKELVFRAAIGPGSELLEGVRLKPGQGLAGWVVQARQPVLVNDVQHDERFYPAIDARTAFQTHSILAAPLQDHNRLLGVIEVVNTTKAQRFGDEDLRLLTALAPHASVAIRNAQAVSRIQDENRYLHATLEEQYQGLIGDSQPMQQILQMARRAAGTDVTVLLLGESGVGKEILARSIHAWSPRATQPFIAVNCVALSDQLLESELFGHEKGAFTGAVQQKKGLFEVAHGGSIFLDEIGDMKPDLQAKLLRVLQDHELTRVGGTHPLRVDLRVIAATNQDLAVAVREGRFRRDLFYRLNVVTIVLPPLRDRVADIPSLAQHFLERSCRDLKRPPMTFAPETLRLLQDYDWPGNVRELKNVIERAAVLTLGPVIHPEDAMLTPAAALSGSSQEPGESLLDLPFHDSVDAHKRALIQHAIEKAGGSKTKAAALLKLQPTYLSRLCKQFRIP